MRFLNRPGVSHKARIDVGFFTWGCVGLSIAVTKFHHYGIWIEDDVSDIVDPSEAFHDGIFSNDLFNISTDNHNYTLRFQEIGPNQYHGIIVRTKDESGFLRLSGGSLEQFSNVVDGDGEIGEAKFDHVNLAVIVNNSGLDLLVEVGFQTPGIGVISNYLRQHLDASLGCDIKHKTKFRQDAEENLDRLLDDELKKIEVSFTKDPRVYEDLDLDEALKAMVPEDYRLKFEVSLEQGKKSEGRGVDDYLSHICSMLGKNEGSTKESIKMIDFPKIMNIFRVTGVEDGEMVEENLADMTLQDKIDTSGYGIFDSELGERLCERIVSQQER